MDQERIAELREEIARNKVTGYHDEGIGTFDSPTMEAAIDALEATQAELATAREVIEESMEARRTSEAEGGALNQLNNEIDRLRAELAALRGKRQASEVAFGEWFEVHFADWLRAMRGGFRHDDVRHFRDSLLTAWSAALRGQVGGVVPELTEAELLEIYRACKTDLVEAGGRPSLWAAKRITEWFRSRLPLSRVAGEGCVAVSADLLILVDKALESCRYTQQHILREAIQSALRATNGKGEATPATPDPAP